MSRWKAHHIEKHRIHDTGQYRRRLAMPERRLRECWIEENAICAELLDDVLPQLDALSDVLTPLRLSNETAHFVDSEEEKRVISVLRLAEEGFAQLSP